MVRCDSRTVACLKGLLILRGKFTLDPVVPISKPHCPVMLDFRKGVGRSAPSPPPPIQLQHPLASDSTAPPPSTTHMPTPLFAQSVWASTGLGLLSQCLPPLSSESQKLLFLQSPLALRIPTFQFPAPVSASLPQMVPTPLAPPSSCMHTVPS